MTLKITTHFDGREPASFIMNEEHVRSVLADFLVGWDDADAEKAPDGELEMDLALMLAEDGLRLLAEAGDLPPAEIESINRYAGLVKQVDLTVLAPA